MTFTETIEALGKELGVKLEACMRRMDTVLAGGQGGGVADSPSSAEDEQ